MSFTMSAFREISEAVMNINVSYSTALDHGLATDCPETVTEKEAKVTFFALLHEIVAPAVFGVITIVGILGNALVIYVILSRSHMRTTMNVLLLNLGLADMCFLVLCVPLTAYHYASPKWMLGEWPCKLWQYPMFVAFYVNMYTLVLISLWRYITVAHGRISASALMKNIKTPIYSVVAMWVTFILANLPTLFAFELKTLEGDGCEEDYNYCGASNLEHLKIIYMIFFIAGYTVPFLVMIILYVLLWLFVKKNSFQARGASARQEDQRTQKLTRLLWTVVLAFCLSWLPLHLCMLLAFHADQSVTGSYSFQVFRVLAQCLAYSNCCMNPIIYCFTATNFRKCFKELLASCTCRRVHGAQLTPTGVPGEYRTESNSVRSSCV